MDIWQKFEEIWFRFEVRSAITYSIIYITKLQSIIIEVNISWYFHGITHCFEFIPKAFTYE